MMISVILCTYNRCRSLAKALDSVAASELPDPVDWEVLVVDNNSSDQTREVVARFCQEHPRRFRYFFERQQGKSYALNSGVREAFGDVLAFMDDDVIVEPTWLRNLTGALGNCEWSGAGGRILPERPFVPPKWLSVEEHAQGALVIFDQGSQPGQLSLPPYGTNMAFRKSMFEKYGGFRTDLGPRPGSLIINEDIEFGLRLLNAGKRLRYEPSAIVYHAVPEGRLGKRYIRRWHFDKARSDIRLHGIPSETRWSVLGVPLIVFRRLVRWALQSMVTFDQRRRFDCTLKIARNAGTIAEYLRLWRESTQVL